MFKFFTNLFTHKKRQVEQRMQEYDALLQACREQIDQMQTQLTAYNKMEQEHLEKEQQEKAKREGKDPWVEIRGADYNDVKGIQIELDWNEAFVQYLKDSGIAGRDDETIVQKWIAMLYHDLMEKLEHNVVENSDKIRPSEFM